MDNTYSLDSIKNIFLSHPEPLSKSDIKKLLRKANPKIKEADIYEALKELHVQQIIRFEHGKWILAENRTHANRSHTINSLLLGNETREILSIPDVTASSIINRNDKPFNREATDEWSEFRKLLRYYIRCLMAEEGAEASAWLNQIGSKFIYLQSPATRLPLSGHSWFLDIPIVPSVSQFVNNISKVASDRGVVLGYPMFAINLEKSDDSDNTLIKPIFYFQLEYRIANGFLHLSIEKAKIEINLSWLELAFKGSPERQRAFLSACGIMENSNDSDLFSNGGDDQLSISTLTSIVETFLKKSILEPLDTAFITNTPLLSKSRTGIYNRMVLMLAKKTRYSSRVCVELSQISESTDAELDSTALSFVFRNPPLSVTDNSEISSEKVVPEVFQLNSEQREGVASLIQNSLTVITGPPGTGKSQVVGAAAGALRIMDLSLLFSSRNHKAVDTVMGRAHSDDGNPFITRTNSKDDPSLQYNFDTAIRDLLAASHHSSAQSEFLELKKELVKYLDRRGSEAAKALDIMRANQKSGRLQGRISILRSEMASHGDMLSDESLSSIRTDALQRICALAKDFAQSKRQTSFSTRCIWLFNLLKARYVRKLLRTSPGFLPAADTSFVSLFDAVIKQMPDLENILELCALCKSVVLVEDFLRQQPPLSEYTSSISAATATIAHLTKDLLCLDFQRRNGQQPGKGREDMAQLRHALKTVGRGFSDHKTAQSVRDLLAENLDTIIHAFPAWAVTSLSVGKYIPLLPGMFDIAIVDEASQSDIPSAIPLLFRAKRAGIVGDPWQLPAITKLSPQRNAILMKEENISAWGMRFSYTDNSLYDLVAGCAQVKPIMLMETFRSASEIASYSNDLFYGKKLRIGTNEQSLRIPTGMKAGIVWTDIRGEVVGGSARGCHCSDEIDEIERLVRSLLLDNSFKGSVGIVTPFRQQAMRIMDRLFSSDTVFYTALTAANCHVDTAHGFQGDERDVMFFSLCGGPGMPQGSFTFLRDTGRLFNVAVSRARAVMHVVGNLDWAKSCGINHIERLANFEYSRMSQPQSSPWHPHESPWEKKLYDAMLERGLESRPQYPAGSRRLDLALVDKDRNIFIDIEVDGDCHRNDDGTRRIDDVWRDIQLQGMGWLVLRFWTYELRENMADCLDRIEQAWQRTEQTL